MNKYEKGKVVKGTVSGITKYGIFISFEDYYSGLIHISEISNNFVKDINDYAKIGDVIEVKILDVDNETNHLKLSIKDIGYNKKKNVRKRKIIETTNGFNTLSKKLPEWIEENLKKAENV